MRQLVRQGREASDLPIRLDDPMYDPQCRLTANHKLSHTFPCATIESPCFLTVGMFAIHTNAFVVFAEGLRRVKPSRYHTTSLRICGTTLEIMLYLFIDSPVIVRSVR